MVIAVLLAVQRSRVDTLTLHHYLGHRRLGYGFLKTTKPRCAILRCSRAHLGEPHAVTQCARAHIKYIAAYSAFMFYFLLTLRSQSKVHKHLSSSHARVPRSAQAPRLRAWPRSQIQHGMLRAHMRERERRAWPRPLIWYNVRSIVCARLSLSLFGAPPQKDFEARLQ